MEGVWENQPLMTILVVPPTWFLDGKMGLCKIGLFKVGRAPVLAGDVFDVMRGVRKIGELQVRQLPLSPDGLALGVSSAALEVGDELRAQKGDSL